MGSRAQDLVGLERYPDQHLEYGLRLKCFSEGGGLGLDSLDFEVLGLGSGGLGARGCLEFEAWEGGRGIGDWGLKGWSSVFGADVQGVGYRVWGVEVKV